MSRLMRHFISVLLLTALAAPLFAGDEGENVVFASRASGAIALPSGSKPGDVVWDSGPSAPLEAPLKALLFQGVLADARVSFEALLEAPGSRWSPASITVYPNGRFWGKVRLSGPTGAVVRLRAVSLGGAASRLELLSVRATRLETEPRASMRAGLLSIRRPKPIPAAPAPSPKAKLKPDVISRKAWGAKAATDDYEATTLERISIHHTEGAQPLTLEDGIHEMRLIQDFHQNGRDWIDIGYHYLIDGAGRIYEGRPLGTMGAHVLHKNPGNIGIALMGHFHDPKNQTPTPEQLRSLVALAGWLTSGYAIEAKNILGHRDQGDTSCPGDNLYAKLQEIRVAATLPAPPATAVAKEPSRAGAVIKDMGIAPRFDGVVR